MNLRKKISENPSKQEGIEQIKFALGFILNYTEGVIKKLEDNKLSWLERVSLITELAPLLVVIKNWSVLKAQILDLDDDEKQELKSFVVMEFDIPNDNVEKIVEAALGLLINLFGLLEFVTKK